MMQREAIVVAILVSLGAGLRLVFRDLPNFAPVAAIALFSGYFFRHRAVAIGVPLAAMLVSDFFIGSYAWQMMALVYAMLTLPALLGGPLRRQMRLRGPAASACRSLAVLLTCSLGASLAFFFVTNFGAWLWFDSYPKSLPGLAACYAAAIPFFRYTLSGDLIFAVLLFGTYAVSAQLAARCQIHQSQGRQPAVAE